MATQSPQAKSLFAPLKNALTNATRPSGDHARKKLADAQERAQREDHAWRASVVAVEGGADPAIEAAAEAKLTKARQEVARLQVVLQEVERLDAEAARAKQEAAQANLDAEAIGAFDAVVKAAQAAGPALAGYVASYQALTQAFDRVRVLSVRNPRVRQDLLAQNIPALVALELSRVSAGQIRPPGHDIWAAAARDPAEITPLATYFGEIATALRKGLQS